MLTTTLTFVGFSNNPYAIRFFNGGKLFTEVRADQRNVDFLWNWEASAMNKLLEIIRRCLRGDDGLWFNGSEENATVIYERVKKQFTLVNEFSNLTRMDDIENLILKISKQKTPK
ncbi:MAG: hypothetical protein PHG05_00465 [Candidatus Nanoarchaeia archaeon]|nr:hypothetical protein [Candidatus Nanoarchaeia archaeon]